VREFVVLLPGGRRFDPLVGIGRQALDGGLDRIESFGSFRVRRHDVRSVLVFATDGVAVDNEAHG